MARPTSQSSYRFLSILHVLSPTSVLCYYLLVAVILTFNPRKDCVRFRRSFQRPIEIVLTVCNGLGYIVESIVAVHAQDHALQKTDAYLVFASYSILGWLILLLGLIDAGEQDSNQHIHGAWLIAACFEALFVVCASVDLEIEDHEIIFRIFHLVLTAGLILSAVATRYWRKADPLDEEIAPLLVKSASDDTVEPLTNNLISYGTTVIENETSRAAAKGSDNKSASDSDDADDADDDDDDDDAQDRAVQKIKQNWWPYLKSFSIFIPYIWTKGLSFRLQILGLVFTVAVQRLLNVIVPLMLACAVDAMTMTKSNLIILVPWRYIALYVILGFINTGGVNMLRAVLWRPIQQHIELQLQTAAYNHVMHLSCNFHSSKKTGKMWQTMERGRSIAKLFQTIALRLVPLGIDLIVAIVFLCLYFDVYLGFIVVSAATLFSWAQMKATPEKVSRYRDYVKKWRDQWQQMFESISNWSTVSYFGRAQHEMGRYRERIVKTQVAFLAYFLFAGLVNLTKEFALESGRFAALVLVAWQIVHGKRPVGDFILLMSYWSVITTPLEYFAEGFGEIAENLVDAEKLRVLLEKKPSVQDSQDAPGYVFKGGAVEFENVSFSYDGKRNIADNVSFRINPGETVALVGETGGGKSTLLKLLFRFYDPTEGRILVDNQNIRSVGLGSFRAAIGVVPQDPALFNLSITDNLKYPDLEATTEQIVEICKAVSLHEKIMSFPKGYETIVGERGVKLSGGELQRVAIARAMLMNPHILLLDEATSSVDTVTEAQIQKSLGELSESRTTLVVAHRLSTIVKAHKILVIENGVIVQSGIHADLSKQIGGKYHSLWQNQTGDVSSDTRGKSMSRSRSPGKSQHVLRNVPFDGEESSQLLRNSDDMVDGDHNHNDVVAKQEESPRHEHESHLASHEAEIPRGRTPRREAIRSLRRRLSQSKCPKRSESSSSLPSFATPIALKPEAPEFIPRNLQGTIISAPISPVRSIEEVYKINHQPMLQVSESSSLSTILMDTGDKIKEQNELIGLQLSRSVSALESIPEEKQFSKWSFKRTSKPPTSNSATTNPVPAMDVDKVIDVCSVGSANSDEKKAASSRRTVVPTRRIKSKSESLNQSLDGSGELSSVHPWPLGLTVAMGKTRAVEPRRTISAKVGPFANTSQVHASAAFEQMNAGEIRNVNSGSLARRRNASSSTASPGPDFRSPCEARMGGIRLTSEDSGLATPRVLAPANTPMTPNSPNSPEGGDEGERGLFEHHHSSTEDDAQGGTQSIAFL